MSLNAEVSKYSRFRWELAAAGGMLETSIRQPLMAITSVMISKQTSPISAIADLYKRGGFLFFYSGLQGLGIATTQRLIHRVSTFGANQSLRENGYKLPAIAVATACLETLSTITGEMFLTLAQVQKSQISIHQIIQNQIKIEGWNSLAKGVVASMGRNISFNGVFFSLSYFHPKQVKEYPISSSFFSASLAVLASHFFEVLRVKKVSSVNSSYLQIISNLYRKLGIRIFVIGIWPRLLSVGVGAFVAMSFFNKMTSKGIGDGNQ